MIVHTTGMNHLKALSDNQELRLSLITLFILV